MTDATSRGDNTDVTIPPIFVISLARAQARRATIGARLAALRLPYTFIDATDGAVLDLHRHSAYAGHWRRLFFGRDLTPGEFGCLISHRGVYEQIIRHSIDRAIVLEDDAIVTDDFPAVVAALCASPVHWDLVRFLGRSKVYRSSRRLVHLNGPYLLARPSGTPGGAYGYLLTRHAAERLLRIMQHNWLPVDTLHGQVWRTGLQALNISPSPVLPDDKTPSCIGDTRYDKTPQLRGARKMIYPLFRFIWKIYSAVWTTWTALRTWPADLIVRHRHGADSSTIP